MPKQKDYYEILGVARDATADEIRKAYLKLAHKFHPDKTGGDKEAEHKLKEINEAYDTLKNSDKRRKYDQFGAAGEQFGSGFEGFGFGGGGFDAESPFGDLFDVIFGRGAAGMGGGARTSMRPGNDLEYRVSVTLQEVAFGAKKTIRFNRMELCGDCDGTGAAPGSSPLRCPDCGGIGQVRRAQGFFSITQTCPRCRGRGQIVDRPCATCGGSRMTKVQRELNLDLPPGVETGTRLRISGEGEPGDSGGPRGDLYILVEVEPHEIFEREGNDIVCEVPISFPEAALGTTLRVPTLKGEAELKVPAGTQSGTMFRLRGLGVPGLRGARHGDEKVRIQVETPTKLNKEEKELLQRLQEIMDEHSHPIHKRFMDKIKRSFGG